MNESLENQLPLKQEKIENDEVKQEIEIGEPFINDEVIGECLNLNPFVKQESCIFIAECELNSQDTGQDGLKVTKEGQIINENKSHNILAGTIFSSDASSENAIRCVNENEIYNCRQCDYQTRNKRKFNIHSRTHTFENFFKCSYCDFECSDIAILQNHSTTKHSEKHPLKKIKKTKEKILKQCPYCERRFAKLFHLKLHIMLHTGEKPYQCDHCNYRSRLKSQLRKHISTHTGERLQHPCSHCKQRCVTAKSLLLHIKRKHSKTPPEKILHCPHCNFECSSVAILQKHSTTEHREKHPLKKIKKSKEKILKHQCPYCERRFAKVFHLKLHIRIHTEETPFQCDHCDYSCHLKSQLRRHIMTHMGKSLQHPCPQCKQRFVTAKSLQLHIKRKHSKTPTEKPFHCPHCNFKCSDVAILQKHSTTEHNEKHPLNQIKTKKEKILKYQCPHCELRFAHLYPLKLHMMIHTGEKPFECAQCNYKSRLKSQLRRHIRTHTGERLHPCPHCEHRCVTAKNLEWHIKRKHSKTSPKKPFHCPHCDFKCSDISILIKHSTTEHSEKQDLNEIIRNGKILKYKCPHCELRFAHLYPLKLHIMNHTGEKPFECAQCNYKSRLKSQLRIHIRTHTGERLHPCPHCEHRCATAKNLEWHIKRKHSKTPPEKPFHCPHCDYKSSQKGSLKVHILLHSDNKPFQCSVCDFQTVARKHLQIHMMSHTGEKPFHCLYCEYRSAIKSNLNKHIRVHNKSNKHKGTNNKPKIAIKL